MAIIGRKCHVGRAEVQNEHQLIIKKNKNKMRIHCCGQ